MSTPFQGQPGAQKTYNALRAPRREVGPGDMADMLGAHQNRLEDLDRRVTALEGAGRQDEAEDETQDGE
jgi:hypothetical protein